MRIYRMTATFGKLERETLTLEPGLNVIEAPNEWGKTTWCAFLMTMLYGVDTRAKSTKTALADKERYAPWSGSPMSGRIDLNWNGRDITIERSTKGRTPMGVFRAYETGSGLAVPELTAANCGCVLLGVEQSVYRRTGFIRQSDMPVQEDDALRRRLNSLVTTGDESGESDKLAAELKELKNKCRYNRTGLLPQAEAKRRELEDKIGELESLDTHSRKLKERLGEVKSWVRVLENHRDALLYASAEADAQRVAEVRDQRDWLEAEMSGLEQVCSKLPSREDVKRKIKAIEDYREALEEYRAEEAGMMEQPEAPVPPELFRGMTLEQAEQMVEKDCDRYTRLTKCRTHLLFLIMMFLFAVAAAAAAVIREYAIAVICLALGVYFLVLSLQKKSRLHQQMAALEEKYGSEFPEAWMTRLRSYAQEKKEFDQALLDYRVSRGDLDIRGTFLQKQRESLLGSQAPEKVLEVWQQMQKHWEAYDVSCREFQQADRYLNMLCDMAKPAVKPPSMADILTYPAEETEKLLAEANGEQHRLQNRLGQYQGRMEALGDSHALQLQLQAVDQRIAKLEDIYAAASLGLETLAQAQREMQRRFAPRISRRAQELMAKMTGGRYDRLTLSEDLSLLAGAEQEETLHETLWRSDGTVDQLYLSLRLAAAEELIPDAPLVLDDAFVRFDDARLEAALEILQESAQEKQVILFTCQHREKELLA